MKAIKTLGLALALAATSIGFASQAHALKTREITPEIQRAVDIAMEELRQRNEAAREKQRNEAAIARQRKEADMARQEAWEQEQRRAREEEEKADQARARQKAQQENADRMKADQARAQEARKRETEQKARDAAQAVEAAKPVNQLWLAYASYIVLKQCHEIRKGYLVVYVNDVEMERARVAMPQIEAAMIAKDPSIDKTALWNSVVTKNAEFDSSAWSRSFCEAGLANIMKLAPQKPVSKDWDTEPKAPPLECVFCTK